MNLKLPQKWESCCEPSKSITVWNKSCPYFTWCFYLIFSSSLFLSVYLSLSLSPATILRSPVFNDTVVTMPQVKAPWLPGFQRELLREPQWEREMCSSQVFHCLLNCLGPGTALSPAFLVSHSSNFSGQQSFSQSYKCTWNTRPFCWNNGWTL